MTTRRNATAGTPFVLHAMTPLPDAATPGPDVEYDTGRQLWVSVVSHRPLVLEDIEQRSRHDSSHRASTVGETVMTKTSEGTDQTESVGSSSFGETVTTRTAEGSDQREAVSTNFGETVITETREGTDRSESVSRSSTFGETLHTATKEGIDQKEATA